MGNTHVETNVLPSSLSDTEIMLLIKPLWQEVQDKFHSYGKEEQAQVFPYSQRVEQRSSGQDETRLLHSYAEV